jgi:hypothetical protein
MGFKIKEPRMYLDVLCRPRILLPMDIEQLPPNKPNFLLVVILSGVVLIAIFILAYFFVSFDGNHLTFRHHSAHPTSQLVLPAPPPRTQLA